MSAESTARDAEFDAITEKEIFDEAVDRLQISASADSKNRDRAKEAKQFRQGEGHWDNLPNGTVSQQEPQIVVNLLDSYVTRVENNIRQQRPRGKCHPVGDGANVDTAETINGIGRHIEVRSEAGVAYDQASRDQLDGGWGYFRLIAEYLPDSLQKDLRILPIRNVFTVYDDPAALMPTACDRDWALISIKQKKNEYLRMYPKAALQDWADFTGDKRTGDWQNKEEIRLAEYFRIRLKEDTLWGFRNAQGQEFTKYQSELPNLKLLQENDQKLPEDQRMIQGSRPAVKRQPQWFKLNGCKVVTREQLPGTFIPLFRVEGNAVDIDGEIIRTGMVQSMMGPQRMVDYGETAKIKRLGLAPKAPWVMAEGQMEGHPEWTDANTQPYSVLVYKPVVVATSQGDEILPPPMRQPPAQIEAGFAEFVQGMRTNLLAIAGMEHQPDADAKGEVISGRALKQRAKMSDQSHFHYYDNLTLAIAQCWRVMLEWIPHYYSEPGRIQRIIGEDSTPEMVTLNAKGPDNVIKNNINVGRYDVVMDTGPGYETKREEGAETLLELMNSPLGEPISKKGPDLVIRSIDHPYMQELADRFIADTPEGLKKIMKDLPERARSIVQALGSENQQLKQALQQAQMEAKYKLAATHMQTTVKAHDVEESNKTKRFDTMVRSHTELAKEEIAAGAKILDSHVVHGHQAQMLERELEHGAEQAEADRGAKPNGAE